MNMVSRWWLHDFFNTVTSVNQRFINIEADSASSSLSSQFCGPIGKDEGSWDVTWCPGSDHQVMSKIPSVKEHQFIHFIGKRAEVCQMYWQECGAKSPLLQLNERFGSFTLPVSCASHRELLLLQPNVQKNFQGRGKMAKKHPQLTCRCLEVPPERTGWWRDWLNHKKHTKHKSTREQRTKAAIRGVIFQDGINQVSGNLKRKCLAICEDIEDLA